MIPLPGPQAEVASKAPPCSDRSAAHLPAHAPAFVSTATMAGLLCGLALGGSAVSAVDEIGAAGPKGGHLKNVFSSTGPQAMSPLPPADFRMADLRLTLTRQTGAIAQPMQRLAVSGAGEATFTLGSTSKGFAFSADELLATLNTLLVIKFFDMPTDYSARRSYFIRDNGQVGTQMLKLPDLPNTQVCFALPSFQKCVNYDEQQAPVALEGWVQRLFNEARHRSQR